MTELKKLIELIKPYMSGLACGDESGTCELTNCRDCRARNCANDLLANGVIAPPCKVGDAVWFLNIYPSIDMKQNAVYEAKVARVYIEKGTVLTLVVQVKNGWGTTEFSRITDIGKTVFLSREDAEKALKERSEGK